MLGSIIGSLDSGATSLTRVGYLPYGKSGSTGPFGFTGQRVDAETNGLYYYRARHYSPSWGRFLQPDPAGYQGDGHLYVYVDSQLESTTGPFVSTQTIDLVVVILFVMPTISFAWFFGIISGAAFHLFSQIFNKFSP